MKPIVIVAALFASGALAVGQETKKKEQPAKEVPVLCTMEHIPKSWNLKIKSSVAKETMRDNVGIQKFDKPKPFQELRMTLVFTDSPADVKEIRKYVVPETKLPKPGDPAFKTDPKVQLYLFDSDKVLLGKLNLHEVIGEITGVTGDAFRIVCFCEPEMFKKVKKIELRPVFPNK